MTAPLSPEALAPDSIWTDPPEKLPMVFPAWRTKSPPARAAALPPTDKMTDPAAEAEDAPEAITTSPDRETAVPVRRDIEPDSAEADDSSVTVPLVKGPDPERKKMAAPDDAPEPLAISTCPPASPLPPRRLIDPAAEFADAPVWRRMSPLWPALTPERSETWPDAPSRDVPDCMMAAPLIAAELIPEVSVRAPPVLESETPAERCAEAPALA